MKSFFITGLALFFMSLGAQAADVVCSCKGEDKCSDVRISFVPASPGVYMSIEFAYGERNIEGFATVTRNSADESRVFQLGKFYVLEKDGKYELPQRKAECN
jgi:hypothetical protein